MSISRNTDWAGSTSEPMKGRLFIEHIITQNGDWAGSTSEPIEGRLFRDHIFVCVEVLRPSQPNGVMSSAVSLPNHTFTGQT